jgi:N6-L-threonylcarbamoyladenine synthase
VVEDGRRQLANLVYTQEEQHRSFGGVVPELAARAHLEKLPALVTEALDRAAVTPAQLDRVGVTRGPGLVGCLLIGVGVARGLAAGWEKPVVGVNHLWGHIYAALLTDPALEPPLLALVVSGAHSDLVWMPAHGRFEVLGRTRDDAAGEAFDKAARMLGLGYPGGPALDRLARTGDARRQRLPKPSLPGLEFSFSGLKTALLYRLRDLGEAASDGGISPPYQIKTAPTLRPPSRNRWLEPCWKSWRWRSNSGRSNRSSSAAASPPTACSASVRPRLSTPPAPALRFHNCFSAPTTAP